MNQWVAVRCALPVSSATDGRASICSLAHTTMGMMAPVLSWFLLRYLSAYMTRPNPPPLLDVG